MHRLGAIAHLGRLRCRPRSGAVVPGDGLEPRHGSGRALRLRLRDPAGTDRLREGPEVLRLRRPLARRRQARRVRDRRDLRPLLRPRNAGAAYCEVAGARGSRRRPVQHLPDDRGSGRGATGVRRRHHPGIQGMSNALDAWESVAAGWERRRELVWDVSRQVAERLVDALDPKPGETILELARGPGDTGFAAAARLGDSGRLLSTAFAEGMVAAAKRRAAELGLANIEHRVIDG